MAGGIERPILKFSYEAVFVVKLPFDVEGLLKALFIFLASVKSPVGVFLAAGNDSYHAIILPYFFIYSLDAVSLIKT